LIGGESERGEACEQPQDGQTFENILHNYSP